MPLSVVAQRQQRSQTNLEMVTLGLLGRHSGPTYVKDKAKPDIPESKRVKDNEILKIR